MHCGCRSLAAVRLLAVLPCGDGVLVSLRRLPAQEKKPAAKNGKAAPPARSSKKTSCFAPRDGLQLALTYYPAPSARDSSKEKARNIPIVLLHGWKQSRNDYKDLARALQKPVTR